jgi:hypothetical protein
MSLVACRNEEDILHQNRLNDLIYYKERLEQVKNNLNRVDTNSYKKVIENATIKLLNLETALPKTIRVSTAAYILQYKKAYLKINNSNEKRNVLLRDIDLALQQINFLTLDVQAERLMVTTEKEMVNRELDVARSVLLAESDFKTNLVYAANQMKRLDKGIDSTINYYRKESVE